MPSFGTTIEDQITELRGLSRLGTGIQTYELIKVEWPSPTGTIYYAVQQLDEMLAVPPPVSPIVCRIKPQSSPDWFCEINTSGSIGDESISIEAWDADGEIAQHLIDHGEGIKTTVLYWFPQVELLLPTWEGHLKLEDEAEVDTIKLKAVQGFRDAEGKLPGGGRYQHCWTVFGGILDTQDLIDQFTCNYNKHLGGAVGTNNPDTGLPWTFCPRISTGNCTERGVDPLRFYSHRTITATVFNGQTHGGNLFSTSQGNESNLPDAPRVVMGTRRTYGMPVLAFRRDLNNNHPDQGFFNALYEGGFGPVVSITGARIKVDNVEQNANPMHYNYRLGFNAETPASNLSENGYPGFWHIRYNFGWVNPAKVDPSNASASAVTTGLADIRTYTDEDTYTEGVSQNRAWQIARMLCDKRWGYGYDYSRLAIAETWIDTAAWCEEHVRFTDALGNNWDHVRAESNVELIAKKSQEQFEDMCRSGRLSRPFLFDGKIHVVPLKALTFLELEAAPVFYDTGSDRNIIWESGKTTLRISRKSDLDLINQVKVTFDDRSQDWIEQPINPIEDEAAQLVVGDNSRKINSKSYKLLGVDYQPQAVKMGWSLLDLGEFDEGGLQNNLELKFKIWYLDSLTLYPTKVIKVTSDRVQRYLNPQGFPFEYFRIKKMVRSGSLEVEVTVQGYNPDYMDLFEIDAELENGGAGGYCTLTSQCPEGYVCRHGRCVPDVFGAPCWPGIDRVTFGDGIVTIRPLPC